MIKIIADSGCDFTQRMRDEGVAGVPLTLQLGEKEFSDGAELNIKEYIEAIKSTPRGRKSAAPSPEKYYNEYKEGEAVFVVTLSAGVSSSYESAVTAAGMYREDYGDKPIYIIDSRSASAGETLIVHRLLELREKGLTHEEIKKEIDVFVSGLTTYFILEHFDTIVDSGRMNQHVAKLASMLNIVPICGEEGGRMALVTQARGRKKAYLKLIDLIKEKGIGEGHSRLAITHVDCPEEAKKLEDMLTSRLDFKDKLILSPTGLVCTYADYHGLVIAF